MHDLVLQIMRYARGTWRYRWWMLGVAWAVCLVGWTIVARLPDQYSASARVYVDSSSVLRPYLQGLAININDTNRKVFLMTRTLLSRPNLEKVMRMTDLDLRVATEEDKDELLKELKKKINFKGTQRENLYTISYSDDSAELAKLVVKSLLTIFMEGNLGEARKDRDSARLFIEKQVAEYERQIKDTEEELTRFKQKNLGYLMSDSAGAGYYSRLRELQENQERAALELSVAEDKLAAVSRQLEGEEPTFGLAPEAGVPSRQTIQIDTSEIDARVRNVKLKLDDLLIRYTDRHPDVISMRETLASLERERKQFIGDAKKAYAQGVPEEIGGYEVEQNPVYQQMQLSLAELEADVTAKRRVFEEYDTRLKEQEGSLDKVFEIETEQKRIERDLARYKKNHAVLVARMESAELGLKADNSAETVRFRVIDPPRAPVTPSGPNRVLLSSAVLGVGLVFGLSLAFLMSQFRPTYDDRQIMSDTLGVTVLGSVNMVWTSDQVRARKVRNVSFLLSITALLITFGTVLALYQFNIDLLPRLAQSLNLS